MYRPTVLALLVLFVGFIFSGALCSLDVDETLNEDERQAQIDIANHAA